jgi:HNH endonuclease
MKWGVPILALLERCDRAEVEQRIFGPFRGADPEACWAGPGSTYVDISIAGLPRRAHRVAWVLANGREVPDGLVICHSCDNPPCRNPAHLFAATSAVNTADMHAKGRGLVGEQSPKAVLTEPQVLEILSSPSGCRKLARAFGVGRTAVRSVRRGDSWKYLQTPAIIQEADRLKGAA